MLKVNGLVDAGLDESVNNVVGHLGSEKVHVSSNHNAVTTEILRSSIADPVGDLEIELTGDLATDVVDREALNSLRRLGSAVWISYPY